MNILKQNKTTICVIIITFIVTANILYFNVYRFSGYKVSIGGNTITFVKTKKEFNKIYSELQSEIRSKYGNVIIKQDFTLDNERVVDYDVFLSGENLKGVMLKKFNIVAEVLLMKADDRKLAYVASEKVGKQILNSVKDYYSKKTAMDSIRNIEIENKISYEPAKIKLGDLSGSDEVISALIKYNDSAKKPLITVKVVGGTIKEHKIYPSTITKSSNELKAGVSKVQKEGIEGTKKVTTEIIVLNNNIVSEKVLKEEVIAKVQNKEILVGSYNSTSLTATNIISPSRGSISSNFGMRWGKMHKGVDIAANLGTTINAALDGTVTFAGIQDGYGKVIKLSHSGGMETTYAHCSVINVKIGENIKQGEKIGEVGSTGNSTGPHLHFEVRVNGEPQNPEKYVR
ncbi:peptidoglycan DD-metalloendopeptidase family protein [Clostridium sp.]|uniref:peptidoglycan DD-metalloendopeptidase family protein n=1 Tax=Clostridium sp. TaxID=1506 RepID=UPI001A567315|nr:peptidoglycan DD-metalloendopeptidase family protein [Clostridium sp.]MBK5240863.1 peptidoglycan DD-metalloendopeptidase family protein [Clostridium sp.]